MKLQKNRSVKREIAMGLLKLMAKKTYLDITVTDIVNAAGVARATFYRNFRSSGEVIDFIVDEIYEGMLDGILPIIFVKNEEPWREMLLRLFRRLSEQRQDISEIGFRNLSVLFFKISKRIRHLDGYTAESGMHLKYFPEGKISLLVAITKKWLETGMHESPEEMAEFVVSFITF